MTKDEQRNINELAVAIYTNALDELCSEYGDLWYLMLRLTVSVRVRR